MTAGWWQATIQFPPGLRQGRGLLPRPDLTEGGVTLRVFIDETVPLAKRETVRETTAASLLPSLKDHPHFADLAVLVSSAPRRGGWQVSVVALDPSLSPTGAEMAVDAVVLEGLQQALSRL